MRHRYDSHGLDCGGGLRLAQLGRAVGVRGGRGERIPVFETFKVGISFEARKNRMMHENLSGDGTSSSAKKMGEAGWCERAISQPGGNPWANRKSISHRCYLRAEAFEWELTKETIYLPLGCVQGGLLAETTPEPAVCCLLPSEEGTLRKKRLQPGSQGQNLALNVLYVPFGTNKTV